MTIPRRQFLRLAATVGLVSIVPRRAFAQAYPARPVRLIVGSPPGSALDILARMIAQWLTEQLGQPFVIEAKVGAGSNIAIEAVAHAPADGYTLLLVPSAAAINASLYDKLNYNFLRDIAPVAGLVRAPNVMLVNPSVPATTVPAFIAHAKANAGKLNYASPGVGTTPHVAGELFKIMAGIDMLHVPYRGSAPAMTDLIGGRVHVLFTNTPAVEHIRAGTLRALAVTTVTRSETLPELPTMNQFLPGYEASAWFGIGAPRNTPPEIIERLNATINAGLADAKLKPRLADVGGTPITGSPADFGKLLVEETEKWARVIRTANIKAE
jgi:tripartite-type tricarboxylate transporter receptor subunit TctC